MKSLVKKSSVDAALVDADDLRGVVSCLKILIRCKSSFVVSLPSEVKKVVVVVPLVTCNLVTSLSVTSSGVALAWHVCCKTIAEVGR